MFINRLNHLITSHLNPSKIPLSFFKSVAEDSSNRVKHLAVFTTSCKFIMLSNSISDAPPRSCLFAKLIKSQNIGLNIGEERMGFKRDLNSLQ